MTSDNSCENSGGSNPRDTNRWTQITAHLYTNELECQKKNSDDNVSIKVHYFFYERV